MKNITYLYKRNKNLGDKLSSPVNYFELIPKIENLIILGGGVENERSINKINEYGNVVVWGIGLSGTYDKKYKIGKLKCLSWGIRDKNVVVNKDNFLPCSSCLHKMLDNKTKNKEILMYFNFDKEVTSNTNKKKLIKYAKKKKYLYLENSSSINEFKNKWNKSNLVITNSYHGTYWSLLNGKKVIVLGYSSKFISLFKNFGLPTNKIIMYNKSSDDNLFKLLCRNLESYKVKLKNPKKNLENYRKININFAKKLVDKGILKSYKLKGEK